MLLGLSENTFEVTLDTSDYAGEYHVFYNGGQRSTNMVIGCDKSVEQPGIFTDSLHVENVQDKCSQSRDSLATMYILNTDSWCGQVGVPLEGWNNAQRFALHMSKCVLGHY